jgi:hypothetical protein
VGLAVQYTFISEIHVDDLAIHGTYHAQRRRRDIAARVAEQQYQDEEQQRRGNSDGNIQESQGQNEGNSRENKKRNTLSGYKWIAPAFQDRTCQKSESRDDPELCRPSQYVFCV